MVELVGHSFFQCLEYGTGVSYVVNLEGTQCPNIWGTKRIVDLLKPLLTRTLFEWSRIWGFTRCTSLLDFINSVSFSLWSVFICFFVMSLLSLTHCTFPINKVFITYQKKKIQLTLLFLTVALIAHFYTWPNHLKRLSLIFYQWESLLSLSKFPYFKFYLSLISTYPSYCSQINYTHFMNVPS